jgi:hypothetical protein
MADKNGGGPCNATSSKILFHSKTVREISLTRVVGLIFLNQVVLVSPRQIVEEA